MLPRLTADLSLRVLEYSSWETRFQFAEETPEFACFLLHLWSIQDGHYVPATKEPEEGLGVNPGFYVPHSPVDLFNRLYRMRHPFFKLKSLYEGLVVSPELVRPDRKVVWGTKTFGPFDGVLSQKDQVYSFYCQQSVVDFMNGHHRTILTLGNDTHAIDLAQAAVHEILSFYPSVRVSVIETADNGFRNLLKGRSKLPVYVKPTLVRKISQGAYSRVLTQENAEFASQISQCSGTFVIFFSLDTPAGPSSLLFVRLKPGPLVRQSPVRRNQTIYSVSSCLARLRHPWKGFMPINVSGVTCLMGAALRAPTIRVVLILYESEDPTEFKTNLRMTTNPGT